MSGSGGADWLDALSPCRCGSRPIFAAGYSTRGVNAGRCSGFLTCREPEKHDLGDCYAVTWTEETSDQLVEHPILMWENMNIKREEKLQ